MRLPRVEWFHLGAELDRVETALDELSRAVQATGAPTPGLTSEANSLASLLGAAMPVVALDASRGDPDSPDGQEVLELLRRHGSLSDPALGPLLEAAHRRFGTGAADPIPL